jgi:hypothetical protein
VILLLGLFIVLLTFKFSLGVSLEITGDLPLRDLMEILGETEGIEDNIDEDDMDQDECEEDEEGENLPSPIL